MKKLTAGAGAFIVSAVIALGILLAVPQTAYADDTVYDLSDFITWMLARDDLTDAMEADLENAQEMLEGYVESEEIILDDEDDAASLDNIAHAVSILQKIDELRQTDEYFNQLYDMTTLYTNFTMMVGSAYTANVSIYEKDHVSSYGTFANNEGLAWGSSDPTAGWYTAEKAYVTQAMEDLGYDLTDLTSSTWSAVQTQAQTYGTIGHYTGLFYGVSASKDTLMGLGYTTERYLYSTTASYNACYRSKYSSYEAYTIDEFESYLYEYLIEINGGSGDCSDSDDDTASVSWTFDNTTMTLTISGSGAMADYKAKAAPWYFLADGIENIVIEDGVTAIGAYTFYGCSRVSSVTVAGSVTQIGNYAFYNCSGLESLTLSEGLTQIGNYAFYKCSGLESLTLPEGLTYIGNYAFCYCTSMKEVTFPDSLTEIGKYAFSRCSALESLRLPENLTTLGSDAFYYCTSLTAVYIPGNLSSTNMDAFYYCTSLTDVTFAEGITSIPAYLFSGCYGLTEITIPQTVTSIGAYAFYDCSGLEGITIPETVTSIGAYAFCDCTSLKEAVIESGSASLGSGLFQNCTSLTDVSLPDGLTSIKSYMFYGCTALAQIDLPDTLTSISTYAFQNCTALESITIPESVTSVSGYAFYGCTSLTEAVMAGGVKSIYSYAFQNCTVLTSVTLPSTLKTIYAAAFDGCSALTDVYYVGTASTWASGVTVYDENDAITDATFHYIISLSNATVTLSATSYTYDGSAKTPSVTVICDGDTLTAGTDYSVSYADNTDAGTASVMVTGTGDCIGSKTVTFTIMQASIAGADVTLEETSYTYDGTAKTPSAAVTLNGTALSAGSDYTAAYTDNTDAGTGTVTLTGAGNYTGTVTAQFTIAPASISGAQITLSETTYTYSGAANEPVVSVTLDGTALSEGTDYTVSYGNHVNAGTATVTVTGTGNYTDAAETTFTIEALSIADADVSLAYTTVTYSGAALEPAVTVTMDGAILTEGTDYTVSYADNTDAGTAAVTITGTGNCTGTLTTSFTIEQASVSSASVTLEETSFTYDGTEKTPVVTVVSDGRTLVSGSDYAVAYADNTNAGTGSVTVTGTGNYTGTACVSFTIEKASLTEASVTLSADSYTYSGLANEPEAIVIVNGNTLTEGSDYTVSYADNTDAGTAVLTLTGTGNYTGTKTATFTIDQMSLSEASVTLSETTYTYDGNAKTPAAVVVLDGKTLTEETDYTVEYASNTDAGTATVTVVGTGNYRSTASASFTIEPASIASAQVVFEEGYAWTGEALTPVPEVTLNGSVLTYGTDFTVTYEDNIDLGTASAEITGIGNYTGSITGSFRIKTSIADADVTLSEDVFTYDGTAKTPSAAVTLGTAELTEGTDYTVSYLNHTDAGTATVTLTGTGDYTGTKDVTFTIDPLSIADATVTLSATSYTYDGSAKTPAPTVVVSLNGENTTLTKTDDYTVVYEDNTNAGTAAVTVTGTGNYTDSVTTSFKISEQELSSSKVSLSFTSKTYTGSAFSPTVTVKNAAGTELTSGTDYTVKTPSGRKDAGTYTYTIKGIGNYTGTVTKKLTIKQQSLSSSRITLSYTSTTYSGSSKTPTVTVKNAAGKTLTKNTDYTLSYSKSTRKAIGKYTITIKAKSSGNYTGSVKKTYKILPKKVTISSAKSTAKKKLTVKWKSVSGSVTKYQVRYRVKGSSSWTTKTYSSSTKSKTLTGLKSGKYYQVQVRAYRTVSGTNYCGSWSSVKTVKVK